MSIIPKTILCQTAPLPPFFSEPFDFLLTINIFRNFPLPTVTLSTITIPCLYKEWRHTIYPFFFFNFVCLFRQFFFFFFNYIYVFFFFSA